MTATPYLNDAMLPWDELPEDRKRYRRIMGTALVAGVLFSVAIPFVEVPVQDRREAAKVPERIARVVERKIELPPPPPPKPKEKEKEEKPKAEEKKADTPKPVEQVVERPIVSQIKPQAKPEEVQAARTKAQQVLQESGLDSLADLRDFAPTPAASAGLQVGGAEAAGTSRNMLTSKGGSGSGSGGLAAAGYGGSVSSGFGGGAAGGKGSQGELAKAKTTEVKSAIAAAAPQQAGGSDAKSKRSSEDIRRTFDQYSARINNAYQRALRDDPTLQGTVSLKLTIAADGSVSSVSIASSQLNNPDLESRLLTIVRGMNFGAANVESWSGTHNLNLFPG